MQPLKKIDVMRMSAPVTLWLSLWLAVCLPAAAGAADWPQFRGPRGSGVAESAVPVEFGPEKNLIWKTSLPPGHSSPVLSDNRIFLTAHEDGKLFTLCLDRHSGEILWRRQAPRPRKEPFNPTHGPASPTPVTGGTNVYVFFGDFGLISYGPGGEQRWKLPLGPFNNINGHGSSPILAGGKLILICDQDEGSYLLAVNPENGEVVWKTPRPEVTRGYATPAVFRPAEGPAQLIVPGSYVITAYELETGKKVWWAGEMCWQFKSVPVVDGDTIYVNGWEIGGGPGEGFDLPSFEEALARHDSDGDGKLAFEEKAHPMLASRQAFEQLDLDKDGRIGPRDWRFLQARGRTKNGLVALRPGGRKGDLTRKGLVWRYDRALPNTPSPLLYNDVIYLIKDGGILTTLNTAGEVLKQGRLRDAMDKYWASPAAAAGNVFVVSQGCTITALQGGGSWRAAATNQLNGECFATPAIADGRIYVRTLDALYCFGRQ